MAVVQNWTNMTAGVIIFGNLILFLFYAAFKIGWPEVYFSSNDRLGLFLSTSSRRYLSFRLAPVFIAVTFSAAVLMKDSSIDQKIVAGFLTTFVYSILTDGIAIVRLISKSSKIKIFLNRVSQIIIHAVGLFIFAGVGVVSGLVAQSKYIQMLVPTPQGLVDNIWSAVFVAIGIIYINYAYKPRDIEIGVVFRRSKDSIDPVILSKIKTDSAKYNVNPILAEAICIVENIQRPKWLRGIEYFLSRLGKKGSFGIMQVNSDKSVSDVESVEIALRNYLKDTSHLKKFSEIRAAVLKYNPDSSYSDLVIKAMDYLVCGSVEDD